MYLLYSEYQNMGGTLDETLFNEFEFEAETQVDWYTFNRLRNEEEYPERLKRCMYALISLIYRVQQASMLGDDGSGDSNINAAVASQSNDGVSISYNVMSAHDVVESSKTEIESIIQRYLQGVMNSLGRAVLYRGLYPGE